MRIPFPVHIRLWHAFCFAGLLFTAQLLEGTSLYFSVCSVLFIVIATVAFNLAGGLARPSGAYVFFYSVLAVIVGLCWKAMIGEPGDSNLLNPLLTIRVFLAGITAMLAAVYVSRKLTAKRAFLRNAVAEAKMQNATIGCMITGLFLSFLLMVLTWQSGSALSALAQVNRFLPLAMVLGVVHQIRKSGGTSSVNLPVLISGAAIFAMGVLGFSKEGMFTPLLCWAVAAGSQRYKVSTFQAIGAVLVVVFMFRFLVPYSQYGRNLRSETGSVRENFNVAISLLLDLEDVRQKSNALAEDPSADSSKESYYNTPQGFFDRLQMISVDDALIDLTERNGTFGYSPIIMGFENLVPHFLWPNKPNIGFGNVYSHELGGVIAEDDSTTGISFSPSGEGFHIARWTGVLIVAPILWIFLFTLFDSLCGSATESPWGLLVIAQFAHLAPEGMLGGVIYMLGFTTLSIIVAALTAAYVMPVLGTLFKGPEQTGLRRIALVRSIPRRARPVVPSESNGL
ncbi:hypothetical protein EDE15_3481 [Edaphobacter aggregans]|uniref:O-antigen polysaccharide polymerase Wzy-like protein n=2 Tax=Edaphobacter aggregans TaxID=570835 RepID=A0A3R9PU52_9BACT|nr:hypothetical protein EDE15_3481 [Edaphobacter aggregans]